MLKKLEILLFVVLFLVPGMAQSQSSFENDALVIPLETGLYGDGLKVSELNLPETFPAQIDSANTGRYDTFVEVAHDPKGWKILQWAAKNEQLLNLLKYRVQWATLQECADQSINLARESSIRNLLDQMGLKNRRVFVRSQEADTAYIKVYVEECAWVKPVGNNRQRLDHLEHDYDIMFGEFEELKNSIGDVDPTKVWSNFSLGTFGGLTNGRRTTAFIGSAHLFYGQSVMVGGYGLNSLFLKSERQFRDEKLSTYDSGWAAFAGARVWNSFWASAGWFVQENVLDEGPEAGRTPDWFEGLELSAYYMRSNFMISFSYLSGDGRKDDLPLHNDSSIRLGASVGNIWNRR